ncbi:MAG: hypothetical protein AAB443_02775 [Patescibacteria group bacterium]
MYGIPSLDYLAEEFYHPTRSSGFKLGKPKVSSKPLPKPEQLKRVIDLLLSIDLGENHFSLGKKLEALARTLQRCRAELSLNPVVLFKRQYYLPDDIWEALSEGVLEVILIRLGGLQSDELPPKFSLALGLARRVDVDNFNRVLAGRDVILYLANTRKIIRYR